MDATLHADPVPHTEDASPAQRYGLLAAAVVAALLGLTVLDVDGQGTRRHRTAEERTTECIVASAVFVGVTAQHPQ